MHTQLFWQEVEKYVEVPEELKKKIPKGMTQAEIIEFCRDLKCSNKRMQFDLPLEADGNDLDEVNDYWER
jgi:hypothetical protein